MDTLQHEKKKLEKRLRKSFYGAVEDFGMIEPGDKVMVCISGGKDSYTMLDLLLHYQKLPGIDFELVAVNLDQKQPGFPEHILPEYLEGRGIPHRILERDTYSIVKDKVPEGKTMCSLCSRLRRGTLYTAAEEMGCTKIALGHHREDIIETFFLNLFYAGQMEAMPPKYRTDDGKHVVIRPLAYAKEADIAAWATEQVYPIIPCTLCGSQENLQRKAIKKMLQGWDETHPGRVETIFTALKNLHPSHLLDRNAYDFAALQSLLQPVEG